LVLEYPVDDGGGDTNITARFLEVFPSVAEELTET
jgi:hypothetical protein